MSAILATMLLFAAEAIPFNADSMLAAVKSKVRFRFYGDSFVAERVEVEDGVKTNAVVRATPSVEVKKPQPVSVKVNAAPIPPKPQKSVKVSIAPAPPKPTAPAKVSVAPALTKQSEPAPAAAVPPEPKVEQLMTFTADKIAVDNVTKAAVATGHVLAVSKPITLRSDYLNKSADGVLLFSDPTCVTTCSNAVGHTHWNVTGEVEYKALDYVILRDAWLKFFEIPVFYLPYFYYALDTDCGFSWMVGYTGRWGAYLMTKTTYDLIGNSRAKDDSKWLRGATRFDLRTENGVALGEDLDWNLGDFGRGKFKVYYAWDEDYDHYGSYDNAMKDAMYGGLSGLPKYTRYGFDFQHRWEATERDIVRVHATYDSDAYFRNDFGRREFLMLKNEWLSRESSGVFWEHLENVFSFGAEVSGQFNRFFPTTYRLPEVYFDVNPQRLLGTPLIYESANRIGYLGRQSQELGVLSRNNPYCYMPGRWADYETFRLDTYHRISAPFKTMDDILSVVPRLGYHGTFWNQSGEFAETGFEDARNAGSLFRSIAEGGVTFAARGEGMVDDEWSHMVEPYFDVLAQEAWYDGASRNNRAYIFDSIDASCAWEDQFAGRSRNLPYTYYGVTPGLRNAWSKMDERGNLRQILDFDAYVAAQLNRASYFDSTYYSGYEDYHRIAKPGSPNYGRHDGDLVPGARLRWTPADDISLMGRIEYDADDNRIALGDVKWTHKVFKHFSYFARYSMRDYRWWDFSSTPYVTDGTVRMDDAGYGNWANYKQVHAGFTHELCDWLHYSPYIRWDCRVGELDEVGAWIDFLTDCLGFRFQIAYENEYIMPDGYSRYEESWDFGFFIYLRAFGPGSMGSFGN